MDVSSPYSKPSGMTPLLAGKSIAYTRRRPDSGSGSATPAPSHCITRRIEEQTSRNRSRRSSCDTARFVSSSNNSRRSAVRCAWRKFMASSIANATCPATIERKRTSSAGNVFSSELANTSPPNRRCAVVSGSAQMDPMPSSFSLPTATGKRVSFSTDGITTVCWFVYADHTTVSFDGNPRMGSASGMDPWTRHSIFCLVASKTPMVWKGTIWRSSSASRPKRSWLPPARIASPTRISAS